LNNYPAKDYVKAADVNRVVQLTSPAQPSTTPTLEEVVRGLEHLPSAPRVLPRLKQMLCDGNTAMDEVVSMVRLDPGIAARVLQFGNSAYFNHGLRCYTVDEAVQRVGYDQIYELVSTAVASQVLVRPLAVYGLEADDLWAHSITCALAAESIAEQTNADRNIAYTIGLLHSIGMVVIDEWAARNRPGTRFTSRTLPLEACEAERATLGFHQAEAGATLLRSWDFPPAMAEPVRWQYLPNGTAVHFPLAALLHVAKWLRATVLHPALNSPRPHTTLMARLKLTNAQLDRLVAITAAKFKRINVQLADTTPTVAIHFPGGERQVAQHDSAFSR
jgi:HD-like signal output (HDOD) protein